MKLGLALSRSRASFVTLLCAVFFMLAAPARATIAEAMSMRELVADADVIARVTVIGRSARYDASDRIVTDATLRIDEPLYGAGSHARMGAGDELVATRLGGELDGLGLRVEGEATYLVGEELLVFLREQNGELRAVGMSQGVFPISDATGHEMITPNGAGLSLVLPGDPGLADAMPALTAPRPVDVFLDEVRALIAEVHHVR